jgi:hypothetical protein
MNDQPTNTEVIVASELYTVASADVQQGVDDDLTQPDPDEETAQAAIASSTLPPFPAKPESTK